VSSSSSSLPLSSSSSSSSSSLLSERSFWTLKRDVSTVDIDDCAGTTVTHTHTTTTTRYFVSTHLDFLCGDHAYEF
jgi:hypothetical protein